MSELHQPCVVHLSLRKTDVSILDRLRSIADAKYVTAVRIESVFFFEADQVGVSLAFQLVLNEILDLRMNYRNSQQNFRFHCSGRI